jgi:hypothetical protein
VDDVWRDWYPDPREARPRRDRIRAADGDPGPDRRIVPSAFRHLDRPLWRPHHDVAAAVGCAVPLWFSSYATELWQLLLLGLALGLVAASFSVGTPYVARFFPPERRGFAMGFFGAGTVGAALNMFVAPSLINGYGWEAVPRVYAIALLATAVLFWIFSAPDPATATPLPMARQLAVLRDPRVWKYCQYYSIVFGGFTALSIWMPQYFHSEYGFSIAQTSLFAPAARHGRGKSTPPICQRAGRTGRHSRRRSQWSRDATRSIALRGKQTAKLAPGRDTRPVPMADIDPKRISFLVTRRKAGVHACDGYRPSPL